MNDGYVNMWNNWSKRRKGMPVYDNWLDNYKDILDSSKDKAILDLACGNGANTLYLKEKGYNVVATDFAVEALDNVSKQIDDVEVLCFDMRKRFPIPDKSFKVVIADLCLHYFDVDTTKFIVSEIMRVLEDGGVLLARVVRVDDVSFDAMDGEELERHFYFEGDYTKRFFDDDDVLRFFSKVGKLTYVRNVMTRDEDEYKYERKLFEIKVVKDSN